MNFIKFSLNFKTDKIKYLKASKFQNTLGFWEKITQKSSWSH